MGETQVLAPAGIEALQGGEEGAALVAMSRLVHSPYFQRFCEDRRRPMLTNDSLQHARMCCERAIGQRAEMLVEFHAWCEKRGYTDE